MSLLESIVHNDPQQVVKEQGQGTHSRDYAHGQPEADYDLSGILEETCPNGCTLYPPTNCTLKEEGTGITITCPGGSTTNNAVYQPGDTVTLTITQPQTITLQLQAAQQQATLTLEPERLQLTTQHLLQALQTCSPAEVPRALKQALQERLNNTDNQDNQDGQTLLPTTQPLEETEDKTTLYAWYRDEPPLREKLAEFHAESLDCPLQVGYGGELYGLYPQKSLLQHTLTGAPAKAYAAACSTVAIIANAATGNLLGAVLDTATTCIAPVAILSTYSDYVDEYLKAYAALYALSAYQHARHTGRSVVSMANGLGEELASLEEKWDIPQGLQERLRGVRRIEDLADIELDPESVKITADNERVRLAEALRNEETRRAIAEALGQAGDLLESIGEKIASGKKLTPRELEVWQELTEQLESITEILPKAHEVRVTTVVGMAEAGILDRRTAGSILGTSVESARSILKSMERLDRWREVARNIRLFGRTRSLPSAGKMKEFSWGLAAPLLGMFAGTIAAWAAASMEKRDYHTITLIGFEDGCTPIQVSQLYITCGEETTQTQGQEGGAGEGAGGRVPSRSPDYILREWEEKGAGVPP